MNKIQVKHWSIIHFDGTYFVEVNRHPKVGQIINKRKLVKVEQMARFDRKTFYKVIKEEFGENNPFYFFVKERN